MSEFKRVVNSILRLVGIETKSGNRRRLIAEMLGFVPNNLKLYETAFTHRSARRNHRLSENNERLEYLGDAILGAIIADLLYHKFTNEDEGFLTQMRSRIVSGENLSDLSVKIGLDKFIVSQHDIYNKKNMYGDAFEALIGAIYIDKGYKETQHFVIQRIVRYYVDLNKLENTDNNFKSKLIEWAQKNRKEVSFVTDHVGNDSRNYASYVKIDEEMYGPGYGNAKREAEQAAAKITLTKLGEIPEGNV